MLCVRARWGRQTVYSLAVQSGLLGSLSGTQRLALFLAALCHDLEHPVAVAVIIYVVVI